MNDAVNLSMAAAAELGPGLSYERFRKVWRRLVADEGFPAPVHGRTWDRAAVQAWRAARSARQVRQAIRETPAAGRPEDRARLNRLRLDQIRRAG